MSGWSSQSYVVPLSSAVVDVQSSSGVISDHHRPYEMEHERSNNNDDSLYSSSGFEEPYFVTSSGATFCTKDNLLNSVAYVNQEFQLLGFPCVKYDGNKCNSDVIFFINRLYDLLTLYHKTAAVKEDLEIRNHRLTCETDHHQSTTQRLKRLQEQVKRELDQEKEKLRQINQKYKQVCSKLKAEKEEVKRLVAVLQSRDLQHKHEQKKKEKEVHSLKERLHQLLADKAPDRKVGMDLMNVVGRSEGRRATWKTGPGKQEEEMYQMLMSNYEERHRELMQENGELRDCLLSLQRELSALLKRTGDLSVAPVVDRSYHKNMSTSSDEDDNDARSSLSITDFNEGYFQMPYDMVRQEIERTFKETCNQITDSMRKSLSRKMSTSGLSISQNKSDFSEKDVGDKRHSAGESTELERLRKQLVSYKAIIQQQEELIQQSLNSQSQSVENSFLHESQLMEEKENLAEQKKLFLEEKANFDKERKTFTEAAIKLGKERQALNEERARILKQQFLSISPFKDTHSRKVKGDGHGSRLLPATPVFSPAKSNGNTPASNLPTTADLYRALGLSPVSKDGQTPDSAPAASHSRRRGSHSSGVSSSSNIAATDFSPSQTSLVPPAFTRTTTVTTTFATTIATAASASPSSSTSSVPDAGFSLENIRASLLRATFKRTRSDDP